MDMAALYVKHRTPFVMGTTGGDREKLVRDAEAAGVYAVVAPQMGKQVVAFQAAMELLGESFPGAFAGYEMRVIESHQSTKRDTSGTAKVRRRRMRSRGMRCLAANSAGVRCCSLHTHERCSLPLPSLKQSCFPPHDVNTNRPSSRRSSASASTLTTTASRWCASATRSCATCACPRAT